VLHPGRRKGHPCVQIGVVLRHGRESGELGSAAAEPVKVRIDERATELARPVGAEVDEDGAVAVFDRLAAVDHGRLDELVVLVAGVGGFQRFGRPVGRESVPGVDDRLPCAFDAVPALVAIHGPVTSGHRGDFSIVQLVDTPLQELQRFAGAARRRIPAIQKYVDGDISAMAPGRQPDRGQEVILVAVHTASR